MEKEMEQKLRELKRNWISETSCWEILKMANMLDQLCQAKAWKKWLNNTKDK